MGWEDALGWTIPLKIPSQHFLLPLVTQQTYYEMEKRESQKIGPSALLLLHCHSNTFFCYPNRCQHRKQRFISCLITSRSCCHLLLRGFCCCHENGDAHVKPELGSKWIPTRLFLSLQYEIVCGKEKKNHLFSQKTGLRVWNQKTPPSLFRFRASVTLS